MGNTVNCVVLKKEAEAMDSAPHPGELGQRILESVSKEGWTQWLERLTMIINENSISTADPNSMPVIEQHMLGFFFQEGAMGELPQGFQAAAAKK
ncbi:MAG TPA: oxidative damage protection protein [Chromatiaceae bacterium]|jgi:Fe-S cluster biosynthesis and repair protein YggX|nr:oxidative damage protection protein [Chromatiaceae bacterium]HIA08957.1 oxidative damage protection protein [Chromatiaceae bacterium]HIN83176.1 oxidative damage protection protein [Chromatiales bacterium]HIO13696.1 oxidative damage protection protein [Chromatiales bacterium]HIO53597.1 oxidative damage protection protein [Chromatiales bacterium]